MSYYAVRDGRKPGIYDNWSDYGDQVHQYSGSSFKKFHSRGEAQAFIRGNRALHLVLVILGGGRSDGYTDVYTDGLCFMNRQNNPQGGVGVYFDDDQPWNVSEPLNPRGMPTNNRAEIEGATRAAEQSQRDGVDKLRINTDCDLLVRTMHNYMPKWKDNGRRYADKQPVKNQEELCRFDEATKNMDVRCNVSEPLNPRGMPTNNRAEIEGATRAAEQSQRYGVDKLRVNTDCDLLVRTTNNYMPKCNDNERRNADNQPVKNQEELHRFDEATKNMDV